MDELVTGDAVVVELRTAQVPSRALAFALDLLVMVVALTVLALVATRALEQVDPALAAALALVVVLSVFVGYPVLVETLTRGRSLGKAALGLRVVRLDGGPIRFRQALTRALAGFIVDFGVLSGFTGAIAIISALASPQGRRVGDLLAGTVVVRERVPGTASAAAAVAMPPPLAGWAAGVELSRLPDGLALETRQFLLRAERLDPRARARLGTDLASRVSAVVTPAPPPGTPVEPFLAAVLAERRRRESARLAGRPAPPAHPPPSPAPSPTGPPFPVPPAAAPPPGPGGFAPPS